MFVCVHTSCSVREAMHFILFSRFLFFYVSRKVCRVPRLVLSRVIQLSKTKLEKKKNLHTLAADLQHTLEKTPISHASGEC